MRWWDLASPLIIKDVHVNVHGDELPMTVWAPYLERVVDSIYAKWVPDTYDPPEQIPLPAHEKAALFSFASGAGIVAIARSTARQLIDLGRKEDACHYWRQWCLTEGVPVQEKIERRARETKLYLTGSLE